MSAAGRRGAGGTEGGVGMFLFGLAMATAGGYLLTSRVTVQTGYWRLWGRSSFGMTLIPLVVGIGFLFFDARSWIGRILTVLGLVIIFAGVIMNLDILFQPTSLFETIMMLALLGGGVGLVVRSLRPS